MADVLIVCVREDEPLAKAFADMFERAGLHVGGAPGAEDLRACGAALVVWSQASIRSRAFLDAAQRAVNAGKAVVACLIAPPPAASINHAPAFDLSHWQGDPDDPALDPLFFAVDRMVAAQRATAGVAAPVSARAAEAPAPYFNNPPPAAPPYARARAAPPAAAPSRPPPPNYDAPRATARRAAAPAPSGSVADEAQNWAAIRHSRNPEDFLRHLADFGADGAFAELAQMKLAELEAEQRRRRQTPAAAARQDALRGAPVRLDPPTRPQRGEAAPARSRAPTPQPANRPPPAAFEPIRSDAPTRREARRAAPPQQADWRDDPRLPARRDSGPPPRAGGRGIRMMAIIVILGGAALGAGLFAGDRFGALDFLSGGAAQTAEADPWADAPPAAEDAADTSAESSTFADAGAATAPIEPAAAPRREPERAAPVREPPRQRDTAQGGPELPSTRDTTPAPARQQPAAEERQPVTLSPAPAPIQLQPTPAPPTQQQMQTAAIEPPAAQRPARTRPPQVVWAARPSAQRINELFPSRALRANQGGRVELECLIDATGVPRCAVAGESPGGFGFGAAALRASAQFRAQPQLDDGTRSSGAQTRLVIVFRQPQAN